MSLFSGKHMHFKCMPRPETCCTAGEQDAHPMKGHDLCVFSFGANVPPLEKKLARKWIAKGKPGNCPDVSEHTNPDDFSMSIMHALLKLRDTSPGAGGFTSQKIIAYFAEKHPDIEMNVKDTNAALHELLEAKLIRKGRKPHTKHFLLTHGGFALLGYEKAPDVGHTFDTVAAE